MPKGSLLHTHLASSANIKKLFETIKYHDSALYNKIYYISDANAVDNNRATSRIPKSSMPYNFPNNDKALKYTTIIFDQGLCPANTAGWTQLLSAPVSEYENLINSVSYVHGGTEQAWMDLRASGERIWALVKHKGVYKYYFEILLQQIKDDGISHVEIKTTLDQLYTSTKQKTHDGIEYYSETLNIDDAFIIRDSVYNGFGEPPTYGIILAVRRFDDNTKAIAPLDKILEIAKIYPRQIVGIDVFGKETIATNKKNIEGALGDRQAHYGRKPTVTIRDTFWRNHTH